LCVSRVRAYAACVWRVGTSACYGPGSSCHRVSLLALLFVFMRCHGKICFYFGSRIVLFRDIFMVILFTMKSYHLKSRIMLVVSIIRNINILWNYIECVLAVYIRWNIESLEHTHTYVCVCVYKEGEKERAK